jgi:hypothetical protein
VRKCWITSAGGRLRNSVCQEGFEDIWKGWERKAVSILDRSSGPSWAGVAAPDRENSDVHSTC